jgi:hypothetical protein
VCKTSQLQQCAVLVLLDGDMLMLPLSMELEWYGWGHLFFSFPYLIWPTIPSNIVHILTYTCLIVQLFSMMIFLSSPQYIPYRISKITKNHFINNNPTYNDTKHLLIIYSKINFVLVDNTNNFVTQEDTHYFLFDKMHT